MAIRFFSARGVYYGWVVVATMFTTLAIVLGVRFAFGVFYVAILEETGWLRAETAGIFSMTMVVYTLTLVPSGALFDRFGPRRMFPLAALVLCLGFVLCSTIESIWQFYLFYGVLVGMAFSMLGFPTHMSVVPRWFIRHRGLASGLALSGTGVGSLLIALLTKQLILEIGWRGTFLVYGLAMLAILLPINLIFHRHSAHSVGLNHDGAEREENGDLAGALPEGHTMWSAVRQPSFWLLLISVSMLGYVTMTLVVHQTRLSMDYGYTLTVSAFFFGLTGLIRSMGQLLWGALSDRFGKNPIIGLVTLMGMAGVLVLYYSQYIPHIGYLTAFTLLLGLGFLGISAVYASSVSERFYGRHLGKIMGMLDIGFGLGAAGGPWLAGYLFDRHGNYDLTLGLVTGAILVSGVTLMLTNLLRRPTPAA